MAGPRIKSGGDSAIHVFILAPFSYKKDVNARVKPVHDKVNETVMAVLVTAIHALFSD